MSKNESALDLYPPIARTASNVMCKLLFGRSFEDERSLQAQIERINYRNAAANVHPMSAILYTPWLIQLPFLRNKMEKFLREGDEITQFFQDRIDEAAMSYDPQKEPTNYVHTFLKARDSGLGHYFTDDQMLPAVFQLFVGGTETITTTLRWALYLMAKYPTVQESVFDEISTKSEDGKFRKQDMSKLPYTQATIMEVMRLATILPMSAVHRTTKETTVNGYRIPANTRVIPFLYNVHRDEDAFEDALRFEPNRFVQNNGTLVNNPSWIPYSLGRYNLAGIQKIAFTFRSISGKRACPATSLAKVELFSVFASLIYSFRFAFSALDNSHRINEPIIGFSHCPPHHKLVVEKRGPDV